MKSVVYKMNTLKVVRIHTGNITFSDINDDEDFMPLSLWNEGAELSGVDKIEA